MRGFIVLFSLICISATSLDAQKLWSLEECILYAIENNLTIENAEFAIQNAAIGQKLAKNQRLPNLNFSSNLGVNVGRSIDPATNEFVTATNSFNTMNLNTGVTLFNFSGINNSIKSEEHNLLSAQFNRKQTEQDIALAVTSAYLDVLFGKENLKNAQNQLSITVAQLDQILKLIDAGSRPLNERLNLDAQKARDEQQIISVENQIALALLRLRQTMLLPSSESLDIVVPEITVSDEYELMSSDEIYLSALKNQNSIQALEHAILSAQYNEKSVSARKLPSLSAFGGLNTNFSSQLKEGRNFETIITPPENILLNGDPATFSTFVDIPSEVVTSSWGSQIDQNLGGNAGVQVSVPIFNRFANKAAEQRAHIATMQQENNLEQERQNIRNDIELAVTNARAALKSLQAAKRGVEAQQAAYENAQTRYDLGAGNSFELTNTQNLLDNARNSYLISKYDYLFRTKIIDFYTGAPLTLD